MYMYIFYSSESYSFFLIILYSLIIDPAPEQIFLVK